MSEERLKELLCQADEAAGAAPELGDGLARQVRRRAARRRKVTLAAPAALAAVLMIGIGLAFGLMAIPGWSDLVFHQATNPWTRFGWSWCD